MTDCLLLLSSEIQLKSPNWLFGQRKYEEGATAGKTVSRDIESERSQADKKRNGFYDLNWLSPSNEMDEQDSFQRYAFGKSIVFLIHSVLQS